jgi:predicted dehydrogenase
MLLRTVNEFSGFLPDATPNRLSHGSFVSHSLSVPFIEPLRAEIDSFLDAVRGRSPVEVTGEDAARCLEVALECLMA